MDYTHHYDSPLGGITLASDGEALTGLWFDGQKHYASALSQAHMEKDLPVFAEAGRWLDIYFSGKDPGFTPKISMRGTAFRKAVWTVLLSVPYGRTVTYGEVADRVAKRLGLPGMSARAVGGAVGHNAVSLIIPCHRVTGKNGALTGYAGGTDRKKRLLEMEKAYCEVYPHPMLFVKSKKEKP
jgi:methylated-DNA-[protein]-cysteine S-methyltransferase